MKLFSCKVRIMGQVLDEVVKHNVTQAEITVLRSIHGNDAVLDIANTGEVERSEDAERDRLEMTYGDAIVSRLFGKPVARIGDDAPTIAGNRPAHKAKAGAPLELEDV